MLRKLKPFDWFMIINTAALATITATTYFHDDLEFGLYAIAILAFGIWGWRFLRRWDYPLWLIGLVQLGIISHFAGGLVKFGEEGWLYWHYFFGLRYDQIVHFYNSFVAVLGFGAVFRQVGVDLKRMEPFVLVVFVLGLGAIIEIIEYFAVVTIPNVGVGDYANNMQDLILNGIGGITGVVLARVLRRHTESVV